MDMHNPALALRAELEAARRYKEVVDGATFHILQPTPHDMVVAHERYRDEHGRALGVLATRELLERAIVGWEAVTTWHLGHTGPEVPVPFSPEALALLLDMNHNVASVLRGVLYAVHTKRQSELEAARKKSGTGLSET